MEVLTTCSAAMDEVELLAASPAFGAKVITLNTMLGENQASPEWHEKIGAVFAPGGRINQHWYTKRGYAVYKIEERYSYENPHTGEKMKLQAVVSLSGIDYNTSRPTPSCSS